MLTAETQQLRRGLIGGTTMSAIAGVNPWTSPADAYLELTGHLADGKGNDATDAGTLLESAVLNWLEQDTGVELHRDWFVRDPHRPFCGNLDAVCLEGPEPFIAEAKTTGVVGPADGAFGEPDSDEVPDRVIVQVHHYFGVAERARPEWPRFKFALVPVLIGGVGFVRYRVPRNDALVAALREMGQEFFDHNVKLGIPPTDSMPSMEVLKRVRRSHKPTEVPREIVERWLVARAAAAQARADAKPIEDAEDLAKRELIHAMGAGDGATLDGRLVATYCEIHRRAVAATTYRSLKLVKGK